MFYTHPPIFKLSLLSFAILMTQQSFAEESQQLPTITIAVDSTQSAKNSEQTKSYTCGVNQFTVP